MAKVYTEALAGLLPAEPVLVVGQPTTIDPSRAPAGKHVLWIQVRVLPSRIAGDAAGTIVGTDWDAVKDAYADAYADRAVGQIERYAPWLAARILARIVLSPVDLERDNPNLVGGDSLAGSHHLDQNFLFRPAFGWSRYRASVTRLFMVGAFDLARRRYRRRLGLHARQGARRRLIVFGRRLPPCGNPPNVSVSNPVAGASRPVRRPMRRGCFPR